MPWWRGQEGRASEPHTWLWGALGDGCHPEEEEDAVLKGRGEAVGLGKGFGGHWERGS